MAQVVQRVDNPSGPCESIRVVEEHHLGFCLGNAVEYILRASKGTNPIGDLNTAMWYIQRHLANFEGKKQ